MYILYEHERTQNKYTHAHTYIEGCIADMRENIVVLLSNLEHKNIATVCPETSATPFKTRIKGNF